MITINGIKLITVDEMAQLEGTVPNTIKQRLHNYGKKPLSKDALYYYTDYEDIAGVKVGRPTETNKPAKTGKKATSKKSKK